MQAIRPKINGRRDPSAARCLVPRLVLKLARLKWSGSAAVVEDLSPDGAAPGGPAPAHAEDDTGRGNSPSSFQWESPISYAHESYVEPRSTELAQKQGQSSATTSLVHTSALRDGLQPQEASHPTQGSEGIPEQEVGC